MNGQDIRVVGHPFGPLGTARVARCTFASLRAVGANVKVLDIWGQSTPDPVHRVTLAPHLANELGDFNIFHLNGDEVDGALRRLGDLPKSSHNVIYPMWELPRYPDEWARQLERFDEVWAGSQFIADSIAPSVAIPVVHLPVATEVAPATLRGRRYFGIPEAPYAFLFFFDLRSYVERKNPAAVVECFRRAVASRPWSQTCLVMKVHGTGDPPDAIRELAESVEDLGSRVVLIDRLMEEDEVHALIRCCDAFVSLHRAEGYGLGLAESMYLGKPVIGTAYSGNMDFMDAETAHLVDYALVPVPPNAYPHWQDQQWAEPHLDTAVEKMVELLDDPRAGRELGKRASMRIRVDFSFRAAGLRYLDRIDTLSRAPVA